MKCACQALLTIAGDPQHLGARIGFTSILHTWGQTLMHHPHLHCLVPAGGLSRCGHTWIAARNRFLVPVRPLSRLFRGTSLCRLQSAWDNHDLLLAGRLQPLADPCRWRAFIGELYHFDWVVYAKPAFGSPQQVLKYLSRYTHRVAISNQRLLSLADGQVTFRYKDYRNGHRQHRMRLSAVEIIRRFLLHSLPKGFVRIRHFGLLANRSREKNLQICRALLRQKSPPQVPTDSEQSTPNSTTPDDNPCFRCPKCNHPINRLIVLPPVRDGPEHPHFHHW